MLIAGVERKLIECGSDGKGAYLSEDEFKMLRLLTEQKLLTNEQMHTFISRKIKILPDSLRRKLYDWAKYDIVVPSEYLLGKKGRSYNVYRIGKRGLNALIDNEYLEEDKRKMRISKFDKLSNQTHFLSTQHLIIKTLAELDFNENIKSISSANLPYLDSTVGNKLVIPDWILRKGDLHLNIELDVGGEKKDILTEKLKGYITYCKQNPDQKHVVIFAVIDNSFPTKEKFGERNGRIANIKSKFMNLNELHLNNLDVYVLPLYRAHKVASQILAGTLPLKASNKDHEITTAKRLLEVNSYFDYNIEEIDLDDIYPYDVESYMYADKMLRISNTSNTYSETILLVMMEEGLVQNLDRLNYLNILSKEGRLKIKVDKIVGIYRTEEEIEHEPLKVISSRILMASVNEWEEQMEKEPKFYRLVGNITKEEVTYEGSSYNG